MGDLPTATPSYCDSCGILFYILCYQCLVVEGHFLPPLTEKMEEPNTDLNKLKGNKRAYKAAVNRIRVSTEDEIAKYASEDPTGLELAIQDWHEALRQFRDADVQVVSHEDANAEDADNDITDHEKAFRNATAKVISIRGEYDKDSRDREAQAAQGANEDRYHSMDGAQTDPQLAGVCIESEYVSMNGVYQYVSNKQTTKLFWISNPE